MSIHRSGSESVSCSPPRSTLSYCWTTSCPLNFHPCLHEQLESYQNSRQLLKRGRTLQPNLSIASTNSELIVSDTFRIRSRRRWCVTTFIDMHWQINFIVGSYKVGYRVSVDASTRVSNWDTVFEVRVVATPFREGPHAPTRAEGNRTKIIKKSAQQSMMNNVRVSTPIEMKARSYRMWIRNDKGI